jgi:hypothetical protein
MQGGTIKEKQKATSTEKRMLDLPYVTSKLWRYSANAKGLVLAEWRSVLFFLVETRLLPEQPPTAQTNEHQARANPPTHLDPL